MTTWLATALLAAVMVLLPGLLFHMGNGRVALDHFRVPVNGFKSVGLATPLLALVGMTAALWSLGSEPLGLALCPVGPGSCEIVRSSAFSRFAGLPLGAWGAGGYALVLVAWYIYQQTGALMARGPLVAPRGGLSARLRIPGLGSSLCS